MLIPSPAIENVGEIIGIFLSPSVFPYVITVLALALTFKVLRDFRALLDNYNKSTARLHLVANHAILAHRFLKERGLLDEFRVFAKEEGPAYSIDHLSEEMRDEIEKAKEEAEEFAVSE